MTEPEVGFSDRLSRPSRLRIGAIVGAALAVVVGAAAAMGASPSPAGAEAADASASPGASQPARTGDGLGRLDGFGGRGIGGHLGFGGITITAINGSALTLVTIDGWTRTITVTAATDIENDGAAAALTDLEVGDQVRFRQTRNADGTFTIDAIAVVLPHVAGEVTAISGSTITITQIDGSTATIKVDGDTEFRVAGVDAADLADITVGMKLIATGPRNADGSIDATRVHAGDRLRGDGRGGWHGPKPGDPAASPAPSSSTDNG